MKHTKVTLVPLTEDDREQFIRDNQWSFKYGALQEFAHFQQQVLGTDHIDGDGEIISRKTIEHCIDEPDNETYRIMLDGRKVGGVILKIDRETHHNHLEILFTDPDEHSKGIGYGAWQEIEALHPETKVWETCTPYFDKRNIHFYINKCGFSAVEFVCEYHPDPDAPEEENDEGPDEMFRFIKVMNP